MLPATAQGSPDVRLQLLSTPATADPDGAAGCASAEIKCKHGLPNLTNAIEVCAASGRDCVPWCCRPWDDDAEMRMLPADQAWNAEAACQMKMLARDGDPCHLSASLLGAGLCCIPLYIYIFKIRLR